MELRKFRISMKYGTLTPEKSYLFKSTHSYEELYKDCYPREVHVNLDCLSTAFVNPQLTYQNASGAALVLLHPTWYKWMYTDTYIKISAYLIPDSNMPKLDDFLPYTQWPPMILYTGKTRFELMIEEEDYGTGKSLSEAFILILTNPQYDKRLFIDLPVQYMKTTSSKHDVYINCS